jgi:multidrug efflux system outer membrane protein
MAGPGIEVRSVSMNRQGTSGVRRLGRHGLCALALAAVAACTTGTDYAAPRFPFAGGWAAGKSGAPVLLSNTEWWQGFSDRTLNALVARALADNLTIAAASERVLAARAAYRAVPGSASVSSSASITGEGNFGDDPIGVGEGSVGLNWILDPWGGRKANLRSAAARVEQAEAERDAAQLLVLSNLANTYAELRYNQRLLAIRRDEMASRRATLEQTEQMQAEDAATRIDLTRAMARVAEIEAQVPSILAAIEGKKNQLAVLAGTAPGTLDIPLDRAGQPGPRFAPDTGIPSDLLRNRPDIRIAERGYYAAIAETDAARAAQYPSLSLSGTISVSALQGGVSATSYAFGPSIVLPVIPGKAAKAGVELEAAQARAALAVWEQTVMAAIVEVEEALLDYRAVSQSMTAAERSLNLYREARELTREVFRSGDATLTDLINADTDVSRAENALADAQLRKALAYIALNIRLGSGHAAGKADRDS